MCARRDNAHDNWERRWQTSHREEGAFHAPVSAWAMAVCGHLSGHAEGVHELGLAGAELAVDLRGREEVVARWYLPRLRQTARQNGRTGKN